MIEQLIFGVILLIWAYLELESEYPIKGLVIWLVIIALFVLVNLIYIS